jgi:hypothetical protein
VNIHDALGVMRAKGVSDDLALKIITHSPPDDEAEAEQMRSIRRQLLSVSQHPKVLQ